MRSAVTLVCYRYHGPAAADGPPDAPVEPEHGGLRSKRAAALRGPRPQPQRGRGGLPALRAAGGAALRAHEAHGGRRAGDPPPYTRAHVDRVERFMTLSLRYRVLGRPVYWTA